MTSEPPIKSPRKLIEVALPLDAINAAAALEKQPFTHRHPRALHIWWARRPLTAARAVLFAQMVNDPGFQKGSGFRYGKNKQDAALERERLFKIIEDLVKWENTNNEEVLERARVEIRRSWREVCALNKDHPRAVELFDPEKLPAFHDPFAGGGAIPLEAQRLGLEAHASDLNPVAVTINKAMIEIPPRFSGQEPIGPIPKGEKQQALGLEDWAGPKGLAEDVRRYGAWMRDEAQKRIGHLYPKAVITSDMVKERPDLKQYEGQELSVIAWLWARTVYSPNPAYSHVPVPLVSTFILSSKEGKEAYVSPVIEGDLYKFEVRVGHPPKEASEGTKASGRGSNFRCILSGSPISGDYIKTEGQAKRIGSKLLAVIVEGKRGRVYLPPTDQHVELATFATPDWKPTGSVPARLTGGTCVPYGLREWADLFTPRQLVALNTLSDLVQEVVCKVKNDAIAARFTDDSINLNSNGAGATAYAEAIGWYLSLFISRWSDISNSLTSWNTTNQNIRALFARQAIPMVWDYTEVSAFSPVGGFYSTVESISSAMEKIGRGIEGHASQEDARLIQYPPQSTVFSTDPPYYANISYADLSDFFYVWLRRCLQEEAPNLFATIATPKSSELIAAPYRHNSEEESRQFFLSGMTTALENMASGVHPAFPITVYYAYKQSEEEGGEKTYSGWETFLEAIIAAGFEINGTWPVQTEYLSKVIGHNANILSSSIVLVCRKRAFNAETISRREFLRELNAALPEALDEMTRGGVNSPVAPVDLSQAIIGPGMAIFSRYKQVLEANGQPMSVRTALQLINRFLAEDDFDRDTQFCLSWFEQYGWGTESYGHADVLARAKGTSVDGLQQAGVVEAGGGRVRLLRWRELPTTWSPSKDARTPVWEALHQIVRVLNDRGETEAGLVLAQLSRIGEPMRALAYRLYTLCERKGWAEDARFYNEVATAWSGMERAALEASVADTRGSNMDRLDFGSTD